MTPEQEHGHIAHHTGRRWLDLTLALSAMCVSIVSLVVAVHHGLAMDRLVAANSWPFLTYRTEDVDAQGKPRITLTLVNAGVGPARIETFELWWHDQPMSSAADFLARCCGLEAATPGEVPADHSLHLLIGQAAPSVLRANDELNFISLQRSDSPSEVWQRLDAARLEIRMRACFCSVFDECWVSDLRQPRVQRSADCPSVKVPFGVPAQWFGRAAAPGSKSN